MASTNNSSNSNTEAAQPSSTAPTPPSNFSDPLDVPPLKLDIKFVDSRREEGSDSWKYTDTANPEIPAEQVQRMGTDATDSDSWEEYCFVVVRKYSEVSKGSKQTITFEIVLKSQHLIKACQNVMADIRGVSWNSQPVTLDPKMLITYFPRLEKYEQSLKSDTDRTEEDNCVLKSLELLLPHMRKHYKETLARIFSLVQNHEITFDLLYAILLPGRIVIRRCPVTHEICALKLLSADEDTDRRSGERYWRLDCEYLELGMKEDEGAKQDSGRGDNTKQPIQFGMLDTTARICSFDGVAKVSSLVVYPIEFWPDGPEALKTTLLGRAHKWVSLCGVHHVHYKGNAGRYESQFLGEQKLKRYNVLSRIMVDKAGFSRIDADYDLPTPQRIFKPCANDDGMYGLTDEVLLLAPPIVYGFSLSDKLWLEFNVNHVAPIVWNSDAFDGLVLPPERKELLRGLIEVHGRTSSEGPVRFDDFVRGKGQGLIINLFGPPGVGKTLSAEATSEHLRRPLYAVGSGDLGTSARDIDRALRVSFELAAAWRAVLLIDEADVFLEQRSLHDLERNAMVAVFLRHVEYYRGILFMTTNRILTFDEAFLSRIHVALHFDELSVPTKVQIWRGFLRKAGLEEPELKEDLLVKLARRDINGRQIKNACRTATSLAVSRKEKMTYEHLEEALNAMEQFTADFTAISRGEASKKSTPRHGRKWVGILAKIFTRFGEL